MTEFGDQYHGPSINRSVPIPKFVGKQYFFKNLNNNPMDIKCVVVYYLGVVCSSKESFMKDTFADKAVRSNSLFVRGDHCV